MRVALARPAICWQEGRVNWNFTTLDELPTLVWRALETACNEPDNPLRTAAFGTANQFDAALRTVVLRRVDATLRQLVCYTDARAAKVRHIRLNPQVQWLFHDPRDRVQLRVAALAMVHHGDAIAQAAWRSVPEVNRINYCTINPPGTAIQSPEESLPAAWRGRVPAAEEREHGLEHFAVLVTTVEQIEWLQLCADGRHRRASLNWTGEKFSGVWLVP